MYDGQRATTDKQRVFILTRSGFLGQQRNAAISWSGDIAPTFDSLRRQIPAGLNFSMSGLPYWTTDIGGFQGGDPGRSCVSGSLRSLVRVRHVLPDLPHPRRAQGERVVVVWADRRRTILTRYDKLRYRLLPYIYSTCVEGDVEGYTPMRALVMDFPADAKVARHCRPVHVRASAAGQPRNQGRQRLRAAFTCPPGRAGMTSGRSEAARAGNDQCASPFETMPLYVRAGSILPMGPELQYTSEKPADPIELTNLSRSGWRVHPLRRRR